MATILHQAREAFMKATLVTLVVAGALGPAAADELLVGALRDQDGVAVAGAPVVALDAAGAVLARDRTARDGTFALTSAARPVVVLVTADDAEPLRLAVPADGSPVEGIVRRHRAADRFPTVADIAALPAGSLAAIGSVLPYRVAFPGVVSDRWLARGHGVATVEGLPFYRRGDGGDTTSLLPAHAIGALDVHGALEAPWYGDRAGGGVLDARLFDRLDSGRATARDAVLRLGTSTAVLAATSWDADGQRRLVAARAATVIGPLTAGVVAIVGDAPGAHYAGAGAEFGAATRRFDLAGRFALTTDDAAATGSSRDDGSVADAALDATGRGANAIAVRARFRAERSAFGNADAQHHDAALVFGTTRGNELRVSAALALAYGDEHNYGNESSTAYALLPSFAIDAPLGGGVTLHAGTGGSTLGTPGFALARSSLGEVGLAFSDRRRLRAAVYAYSEGNLAPTAVNRGFAASIGWELAPRLSLRAWSLRDGDALEATAQIYPGGPSNTFTLRRRFNRDVAWLTWDAPTRFDLLLRGGALEGSVRVPLSNRYALTAASYLRADATRALNLGLVAR
jgi:hypothetical protein